MILWLGIARSTIRLGYAADGTRARYVVAGRRQAGGAVAFVRDAGGHLKASARNLLPRAAHHPRHPSRDRGPAPAAHAPWPSA